MRSSSCLILALLLSACSSRASSGAADAATSGMADASIQPTTDLNQAADQSGMITYACGAQPSQATVCKEASDCVLVPKGCYCGPQPVHAVEQRYASTASACEDTAAADCTLGCAVQPGLVADDGRTATSLAQLAVRCDRAPGDALGDCSTYVP